MNESDYGFPLINRGKHIQDSMFILISVVYINNIVFNWSFLSYELKFIRDFLIHLHALSDIAIIFEGTQRFIRVNVYSCSSSSFLATLSEQNKDVF